MNDHYHDVLQRKESDWRTGNSGIYTGRLIWGRVQRSSEYW